MRALEAETAVLREEVQRTRDQALLRPETTSTTSERRLGRRKRQSSLLKRWSGSERRN